MLDSNKMGGSGWPEKHTDSKMSHRKGTHGLM